MTSNFRVGEKIRLWHGDDMVDGWAPSVLLLAHGVSVGEYGTSEAAFFLKTGIVQFGKYF